MKKGKYFLCVICFIISCLMCGCSGRVSLDEETQAEVDEDATHAIEDALCYLSEKYSMDYELKSFEPYIYGSTNDPDWFVLSHYDRAWEGEFIVKGETYIIRGNIPKNRYMDNYQFEEIKSVYTELMQQYFADVCGIDGIICEAKVRNEWASHAHIHEILFSVYYDGTNLYDCLKENGLCVEIDITNAGFSEEFLGLCENSVAAFEKDFEGINLDVNIIEGKESVRYTTANYVRFDYDKWVNSKYYGTEGITLRSLKEYIESDDLYIYKYK